METQAQFYMHRNWTIVSGDVTMTVLHRAYLNYLSVAPNDTANMAVVLLACFLNLQPHVERVAQQTWVQGTMAQPRALSARVCQHLRHWVRMGKP